MDDKARFQEIQTKLERYLYDYKNSFPKNIWQIISVDFPLITLIVTALVVIELLGVGVISIAIVLVITIPFLFVITKEKGGVWKKLLTKRQTYRADHQAIIDKINKIETDNLTVYPDVKNYLDNYHSELSAETARKASIRKKYIAIMILGIIGLAAFAVFTLRADTKLWFLKDKETTHAVQLVLSDTSSSHSLRNVYYDGRCYNHLNIDSLTPIAVVKPLKGNNENLKIFFIESERSCLRISTPKIPIETAKDSCIVRIIITYNNGQETNDIPYFDFKYDNGKVNPSFIDSYPIAYDIENHPYEIIRRVKYLQDNAANLRYVIEGIE